MVNIFIIEIYFFIVVKIIQIKQLQSEKTNKEKYLNVNLQLFCLRFFPARVQPYLQEKRSEK